MCDLSLTIKLSFSMKNRKTKKPNKNPKTISLPLSLIKVISFCPSIFVCVCVWKCHFLISLLFFWFMSKMLIWLFAFLSLSYFRNFLFFPGTIGIFSKEAYAWPSSHCNWGVLHWPKSASQRPAENSNTAKHLVKSHPEVASSKHSPFTSKEEQENKNYLVRVVLCCGCSFG